jgi:hypothetical protein
VYVGQNYIQLRCLMRCVRADEHMCIRRWWHGCTPFGVNSAECAHTLTSSNLAIVISVGSKSLYIFGRVIPPFFFKNEKQETEESTLRTLSSLSRTCLILAVCVLCWFHKMPGASAQHRHTRTAGGNDQFACSFHSA